MAGALAELSPDTGVLGGHRLPFTGHALDQAMAAALGPCCSIGGQIKAPTRHVICG
ncbi:hypothetical protein [Streptomyces tendae]